jgi:hypothetical protein
MTKLWKIQCQEDKYPGMWQRWYINQCVAVGWSGKWGFKLEGKSKTNRGWSTARNRLKEIQNGDYVVVALKGHKVGRLGTVYEKAIGDNFWEPLVPPSKSSPDGEKGRRIYVRWILNVGPLNPDLVVQLPGGITFNQGELRPTISQVNSIPVNELINIMNDSSNWVSLLGKFSYERALSDYLSNYPNHLENGLLPYPDAKIREHIFKDKTRLDVLLIDKDNVPVVVECKQHSPSKGDIKQIRNYMSHIQKELDVPIVRGILVHGGAPKLSSEIDQYANGDLKVEVVSYQLSVNFRKG